LTFLIWGVIYLLLALCVTHDLVQSVRVSAASVTFVPRIGLLFIISCLANAAWIFSWHFWSTSCILDMHGDPAGDPGSDLFKIEYWQIICGACRKVSGASADERLFRWAVLLIGIGTGLALLT
jgi:hypothetical protein